VGIQELGRDPALVRGPAAAVVPRTEICPRPVVDLRPAFVRAQVARVGQATSPDGQGDVPVRAVTDQAQAAAGHRVAMFAIFSICQARAAADLRGLGQPQALVHLPEELPLHFCTSIRAASNLVVE
jgi:hypothetical protein